MLKTEKVNINITVRNITHFKKLKYNVKIGESILVNINDLSRYSRVKVDVECEECKNIKKLVYHKYLDNVERYGFYTCKKCSTIKKKMTFNTNYGVDNPMKLQIFKDKGKETKLKKYGDENYNNFQKHKETNLELYGKEHHLQNKNILEKQKQTNIKKYGFEYIVQVPNIKDKIKETKLEKYGNENYNNSSKMSKTKFDRYDFKVYKILNNIVYATCNNNHNFELSCSLFYYRYNSNIIICPICNPIQNNISSIESNLIDFIKEYYSDNIILGDRKILNGKELDIYLPELKLAFEFNGLYWHNELYKDKNYHKNKTELCLEKGIQLIHIYEDDWKYKQNIVKSMILNKLNKIPNKIFARETEIKEINDNNLVKNFLEINHLQGFVGSKIKIGLFYKNQLVSLMTFKQLLKKKTSNGNYEMLRFCNKLNTDVIGSYFKLFKYFIKNYNPNEIISYVDRSYSNGSLFKQLGFKLIQITTPNYYYVIDDVRYYKFNFKKDILVKQGFDKNKSEHEIMLERKFYRIYNSGNYKFKYLNII